MMTDAKCAQCGEWLTLLNGFFELYDSETNGYPAAASTTRTRFGCDACESSAYCIDFVRILSHGLDGAAGWLNHLSHKEWFNAAAGSRLADLYDHLVARSQQDDVAPKRLLTLVKPPRSPRPQTPPRVTPSDNPRTIRPGVRARVMERDGFRCRRCGNGPDVETLVLDHIVPVAKGGTAEEGNLQTLCFSCNAGKSDREPHGHDMRPV